MSSNDPNDAAVSSSDAPKIQVLPKEVVDRIAAGEVVTRPAAVIKELIENCLDAGATEISVTISRDCRTSLQVKDNGKGIRQDDLGLAAVRHATSKLHTCSDFDALQTFGFRGEALASVSMVSKLHITSRVADSPVGYTQHYENGTPNNAQPRPTARTVGTTVSCTDLFYNLKGRQASLRASDEYQLCLQTVQHYAIHHAAQGIGFCCQKALPKKTVTDLNSSQQLPALRALIQSPNTTQLATLQSQVTKRTIAQVYGSQLESQLVALSSQLSHPSDESTKTPKDGEEKKEADNLPPCSYECAGYVTTPWRTVTATSQRKTPTLILFVNHRLVECQPLQRALEQVYGEFGSDNSNKPLMYLSLQVPPDQVDVNVHPTKRQVALLHHEDICKHVADQLRALLSTLSPSFASQSVAIVNPYKKRKEPTKSSKSKTDTSTNDDEENSQDENGAESQSQQPPPDKKKKKAAPNKQIRTFRSQQSGSLEPFLVPTQPSHSSQSQASMSQSQLTPASQSSGADTAARQSTEGSLSSSHASSAATTSSSGHKPHCPLSKVVDLSQPGAFATAVARCVCNEPDESGDPAMAVRLPPSQPTMVRPRKVKPTPCDYKSIAFLRKQIKKRAVQDDSLLTALRQSCFVGVFSRYRSFLQCGEDLVLLNHYECARELFYQLALLRFSDIPLAKLGDAGGSGCVDVSAVMAQALQCAEELQKYKQEPIVDPETLDSVLTVSETNQSDAEQATMSLFEHAPMLEDYFSVVLEEDDDGRIMLTGLPVLLDGYCPAPHGLPVFLLRLAMEVDWSEEKACFHGVCQELAAYYAELPSDDEDLGAHVRHKLFPAVTTLLTPSDQLMSDGFSVITKVSKLYRKFERC